MRFQCSDGSEWETEEQAARQDELLAECDRVAAMLPNVKVDYHQRYGHHLPTLAAYKYEVVALCARRFPNEKMFKYPAADIHPFSYAGRFLDDAAPTIRMRLWYRLQCIDESGYEYEQPFFALNPGKWSGETLREVSS